MLAAMNPWLLTAIAFASGLVIGAFTVWFMTHRGREGGENARRLRRELDGYNQAVSEHFAETAELVHAFDQSYRAVYGHLERGAAQLVGREVVRTLVRDTDSEAVPPAGAAAISDDASPAIEATTDPDAPARRNGGDHEA